MGPLAMAGIYTALNAIGGAIGQRQQYKNQSSLNEQQMRSQMRLNKQVYQQNISMMDYQNAYNSPEAQMARYDKAGLNKNLIYGQGTPGNMANAPQLEAPQVPHQQAPDFAFLSDLGTKLAQARLMNSQADLAEQRTDESGTKQELMEAQTAIARTNPMLDKRVAEEVRLGLIAVANTKRNENTVTWQTHNADGYSPGSRKIMADVEALEKRLGLMNQDKEIKNKILESKEFQNAILEIQKKWATDAEITPQHIYQGIMLLLTKMM